MQIEMNDFRQNKSDMTVHFTLTDGENVYKWHGDIPIMDEAEIQSYLESHIDVYRSGIYRKIYRDAIIASDKPELEAWRELEAAGCINVIEKQIAAEPWEDTH